MEEGGFTERKTKYSVGDRVIIRHDLDVTRMYKMEYDPSVTNDVADSMMKLAGTVVTIERMSGSQYIVTGSDKRWTDEMFIGLESAIFDDDNGDFDHSEFESYIAAICG